MDLVGKYIGGRYAILEKVGNGGMATVYRAKDNVLNRFVAVKVLRDEYTTDSEFIRRFNAEAQAAAGLTHPNIVSVYDVGHEDNVYYIVMELIQGKTLKSIINQDGSLPWKWSVNIAIQIASALEAAHKNNIVHRDIKPHNIIITEDGVAKVTDFGIAKAVSNSTITAFGSTIGSVHYFSPEHAKGGFTDAKSDLYSLGVVMYEMLTGKVPFDADTPVSIALKHMQEIPKQPMQLNPSIPFAVNQIIMKAMQKDPSLRYQSATEMIKDLTNSVKNPEGDFVGDIKEEGVAPINRASNAKRKEKKKGPFAKIGDFFVKHPKTKILLAVIACIILFFAVIFITKAITSIGVVEDVAIPELVNKTEDEIKEMFKDTKFTYEITGEEFDGEIEEGKVISQEPKYRKNFTTKANTHFTIVMSKGLKTIIMPKVEGEKLEEAKQIIDNLDANILIKLEYEESTKVEEGIVLKQSIEKDTEVKAGTELTLKVSKAVPQVAVPYVTGHREEDAKNELESLKLKVKVEYENTDDERKNGTVIKQATEAGKTVDEGTTVTIVVGAYEEVKECIVNVDVSKVSGYISKKDEEGNEIPAEDVKVTIYVDNNEYDTSTAKRDETNYSRTISAKGTVTVKVVITSSSGSNLGTRTKQGINLSSAGSVYFD